MKKVTPSIKKENFKAQPLNLAPEYLQNLIAEKFQGMMAEVNPEYLKKLASLVERELQAKKDTEDYNMDLVSEVVDKAVQVFMEGGQEAIQAGDYLKVQERIISNLEQSSGIEDLKKALASGDYKLYPFSQAVEAELRSIFLLQTNKSDTFKSLMEEMEKLSSKFFPKGQFKILQDIIQKSEERIFKNPLLFPAPLEGNEQGVLRNLTEGEVKEYNLQETMSVDERYDNHDLLALKDLVLMMQGNKVHPLAFGPSFFAKYMPEIKQAGFDGVSLVVEDNQLKQIKLVKLPVGGIRYSPVEASAVAVFSIIAEYKEVAVTEKTINKHKYVLTKFEPKTISDKMRVYLVVDGCIAAPASKVPYDFEGASNNNLRVPAGEVFVLEKMAGQPVLTRIGFVPYDYRPLHILHQHGSVILGSNDQSFHSCYKEKKDFAENTINDYKSWWKKLVDDGVKSQGDAFSPAVVAARLHHFLKDKEGKATEGSDVFKTENKEALELAMHSVSEQSDFTLFWTLQNLHYYHMIYTGSIREEITKLVQHEAPLNRRWLAKAYIENGSGITVKKQPTYYIRLAEDLENAKFSQNVEIYLKLKEINRKISKGLSYEEAIKQVYSAEVAQEYKKLN